MAINATCSSSSAQVEDFYKRLRAYGVNTETRTAHFACRLPYMVIFNVSLILHMNSSVAASLLRWSFHSEAV